MTNPRSSSFDTPRPVRVRAHRALRTACTTAVTAAALVIGAESSAFACSVCFGATESPLLDGAQLGVLAMLAVTFTVQGGCAGFFFYLRKRARRAADTELDSEWLEMQRGRNTR